MLRLVAEVNILLLGPGTNRGRFHTVDSVFDPKADEITVVDTSPAARASWPDAHFVYDFDLRYPPFPLPRGHYDEIHAYGVLNLLHGDEKQFFKFWNEIWRVTKSGAKVFATVPHWRSHWIYAYPCPQRTYTPALLSYLDPGGVDLVARTDFTHLLSVGRGFGIQDAWDVGPVRQIANSVTRR